MSKICYIDKNFRQKSLDIINQANDIIEEYLNQDLNLTLRQLYYQFVARGFLGNRQSNYDLLSRTISDGRLAGLIDWNAIEDRTRNLKGNQHWDNPGQIIRSASWGFRLNHWEGQDHYVEVWIEKEALIGVIDKICRKIDVSFFACKGYVSQSEMWSAAQRLECFNNPIIIHLGDHDPSGIDMTRDIFDRQKLFLGDCVEVKRIALNMDQIEEFNPPPNPAKLSDTRSKSYISKHGNKSWELDALNPSYLRNLIEKIVLSYRNDDIYQEVLNKEFEYKQILERVEQNWRTL